MADNDTEKDFFNKMYIDHKALVFYVVKSTIYSPDAIEDINDLVSNTFLTAMLKPDIQEVRNISAWLCITAKNLTMNLNKGYVRRKERIESLDNYIEIFDIADDLNIESEVITIDEINRCIQVINEKLSTKDKKFYYYKFKMRFPNERIAEMLNISEGSVNTKSGRLKNKIKKIIKKVLYS